MTTRNAAAQADKRLIAARRAYAAAVDAYKAACTARHEAMFAHDTALHAYHDAKRACEAACANPNPLRLCERQQADPE